MNKRFPDVAQSFGRANMSGTLFDTFYDIFLQSHPDITPRFKDTDFTEQKKLLRKGINLALMFAEGQPVGESGIGRIRESHSIDRLNVPPHLYPFWLNSFVKAVARHDPDFTPELEKRWREALQIAIDHIVDGYKASAKDPRAA